jgi:outer membrane protein OmpA-like peptidoglycan-associated protein
VTIPDPPLPTPNPGLEPPITTKTVPPLQTTPQLPPPQLPPQLIDFVGLPLYFDNDEPDKRTRKTTTTLTYESTVMSYLDRQVEYRLKRSEGLSPENAEKAENDIDVFFENEVREGFEKLSQLCELLLVRLETGQSIEIFIKGFTSPRAKSDYNINLGKRRISSVRNYISEWSDESLKPYLINGRLRITETSFGETTARLGLSDDLNDERNSIYHPDAARERRVEIVEIK